MRKRARISGFVLAIVAVSLVLAPLSGPALAQPTQEEVKAAIAKGVAWLAGQQNPDGSWGSWYDVLGATALACKKLEHHAVDPKWGLGLPSPFDPDYAYKSNVEMCLKWLLDKGSTIAIVPQPAGDPDTNGNGLGVLFPGSFYRIYSAGIMLMTLCEAVELDRVVESGPLAGRTYAAVARDVMDYLAWAQNEGPGGQQGGWNYQENSPIRSDNSNSGWVTLGLAFAEAAPPLGCGFTVPQFVKTELNLWIDYIQNDVAVPDLPGCNFANTDACDGGSGYSDPNFWVNILKTGNLLQQMAFVGDTAATQRVKDALVFMETHWASPDVDPGWSGGAGTASYQATFTAMKGFTALDIHTFGTRPIDWQADFERELLAEQNADGSWPFCYWGDQVLCTTWALLTLQKAVPPPPTIEVPVDIKPQSCRNPFNVNQKGVLPAAILGTADFDVTKVDVATVMLEGVAPLRSALEDVATPFVPYTGKSGPFDCTDEGPDGFVDLTLKFDAQAVVAALGPVSDGDVRVLTLTGNLKPEFGGTAIVGEDVIVILKKK